MDNIKLRPHHHHVVQIIAYAGRFGLRPRVRLCDAVAYFIHSPAKSIIIWIIGPSLLFRCVYAPDIFV